MIIDYLSRVSEDLQQGLPERSTHKRTEISGGVQEPPPPPPLLPATAMGVAAATAAKRAVAATENFILVGSCGIVEFGKKEGVD